LFILLVLLFHPSSSSLGVFLVPGSSVLIWCSFFDFKKKLLNLVHTHPNHDYGNLLIPMRVIGLRDDDILNTENS
jgi:hypothetical protein